MSEGRTAAGNARRGGSGPTRLAQAWRSLPHESRLAAFASLGLFVTLFLPWYQVTLIAPAKTAKLQSASATITGWGAFSFVEAAVLLVAMGVVTLLFQRAEGRAFHLPGGDGGVIFAVGLWTCGLVVWRIFDKQGATTNGASATTSGVEWGIFFALAAAAFLAYSGSRIRAAHRPEPPLPGEDRAPAGSNAAATVVRPRTGEAGRADSAARERPRRRARMPTPVPAEPLDPADLPTRSNAPLWTAHPAPPSEAPSSDRPRRRRSASELFERVVPDDPPTMPFGRAKRSDIDPTSRRATEPELPPPSDEQLTIPFADRGSEDATLPLATDRRSRGSEDVTVPLGDDATQRLGEDATQRLGEDATQRLGEDDTLPLDR